MKKLIDPLVFGAIFTAAAAWLAWHMWPTSWWGKLFWLVLVGAAINWAEHYLVFGAYVRGLFAGLILRRQHKDSDQIAIFKCDGNKVVQPLVLRAYLMALQFTSGREYAVCERRFDKIENEWGFTLTTLSEIERARVIAEQDEDQEFVHHFLGIAPPKQQ